MHRNLNGGENKMRGKGSLGAFCPKCQAMLEYEDTIETATGFQKIYTCSKCYSIFYETYKAIEWEEKV